MKIGFHRERLFEIIDDHPTVVEVVARALKQAKDMAAAVQDNHCKNKSRQSMVSIIFHNVAFRFYISIFG